MSFLKRILGELKETTIQMIDDQYKLEREQLLGELCEHLQQFGVKGTPLDPGSPEGFRFPPIVLTSPLLSIVEGWIGWRSGLTKVGDV